jgi:hypothetical protein
MPMRTLLQVITAMAAGALVAALALVGIYDVLTRGNRTIPTDHGQFLVDTVTGPRLVVDGGSSSMFGIVPALLEQAFGRPTVDAADNASIPLRMKIHRIIAYARRGDVLILPLEWVYYTRSATPSDFIDKTPDTYAPYYASLPLNDRLGFAVSALSLHNVSDAFRLFFKPSLARDQLAELGDWLQRFPYGDRKDDRRRRSSVAGQDCAGYLGSDGPIVDDMRWAARTLGRLQHDAGLRIIVTWPAVAGTGCYRGDGLLREARALFAAHGLTTVGDPADSSFKPEHMLDTYYHVDEAAAHERTRRLISHLKALADFPAPDPAARSTVMQGADAFRRLAAQVGRAAR